MTCTAPVRQNSSGHRRATNRLRSLLPIAACLGAIVTGARPTQAQVFYVGNTGDNTIEKFDMSGVGTRFDVTGDVNGPRSMAVDGSGNLYVANINDNTIEKFDRNGVGARFNTSGQLNAPNGLAFDSAGNLYVSNSGNGSIMKFNSSGVGTAFLPNNSFAEPVDLAFDSAGNIYVCDDAIGLIYRFNSNGVRTGSVPGPQFVGTRMLFDSANHLYLTNAGGNNILTKVSFGSLFTVFNQSGNLHTPVGLTQDSAGNLYAVNLGDNTIEKFDSNGVGTRFDKSGKVNSAYSIVYSPALISTPEPGSLALLASLGGVGWGLLARRRRK